MKSDTQLQQDVMAELKCEPTGMPNTSASRFRTAW